TRPLPAADPGRATVRAGRRQRPCRAARLPADRGAGRTAVAPRPRLAAAAGDAGQRRAAVGRRGAGTGDRGPDPAHPALDRAGRRRPGPHRHGAPPAATTRLTPQERVLRATAITRPAGTALP